MVFVSRRSPGVLVVLVYGSYHKEPVIVEKPGKPLAVIISYGDDERFREFEADGQFWGNKVCRNCYISKRHEKQREI